MPSVVRMVVHAGLGKARADEVRATRLLQDALRQGEQYRALLHQRLLSLCTILSRSRDMRDDELQHVQGLLDQPTFSIWLNPNTTAQPAGALLFGGVDSAFYTGSLIPVPVISSKCAYPF